jgi:hypothetical protein
MTQTRPAEEPASEGSAPKRARIENGAAAGGRAEDVTEGRSYSPSQGQDFVLTFIPLICASTDEAALYDRQIRLWGLEAQNR